MVVKGKVRKGKLFTSKGKLNHSFIYKHKKKRRSNVTFFSSFV